MKIICLFIMCTVSLCIGQARLEELGRFGGTGTAPGLFKDPTAIDYSNDGRLFICDRGNQRIQVFDLQGNFRINIGGFGWEKEKFDGPLDVWARSTINIYVADYNNQRVQRFDKDLNFIGSKESNPGSEERFQFREVLSVAYSPQGDLFILDAGDYKVIKFSSQGQGDVAFGYYESGRGQLTDPVQLDVSSDHRIFVSDKEAKAVFIYDYFGNFMNKIEHPRFQQPGGIAFDLNDRLFIADPESQSIFEFTAGGKFINQFNRISGVPLSNPKDLCVTRFNEQTLIYVIDGDDILIAQKYLR